jgi:serine phosphatase RsbU (regulator of sigma subunit)
MEDLIRQIPLFAALPPDEIQLLAKSLRLSRFAAGSILFNEGEPGENFSIVAEGQIEIIQALGTTEERILSIAGPGDFLGEVSLLQPGGLRSATARARSPVRLLEMLPVDFERLIHGQSPMAATLLVEMSHRLRNSQNLTIRHLQEKNQQLAQALATLQAAQEQLLEKEKLEQELRLAHTIQQSTLPKELPVIPGWQLSAFWQPARAVGGDFYDFIPFPDGSLGLIIGDVSGKGMPAALIMATTRTLLRFAALNEAEKQLVHPGKVLAAVNEIGCLEIPAKMFVTCLFAVVNLESGQIRFANAGHTLPFQCSPGGVTELRATGMPLGLLPGMRYEERETTLAVGDSLFLCTDGLVEAHNPQKEMYGLRRLQMQLAAGNQGSSLQIAAVMAQLTEFTGSDGEQEDDMTCVVLQRSG